MTLLGGELAEREDAVFGLDTVQQLQQYHADFAFVAAQAASCAVVVADRSKFGAVTPVRIRGFETVRYLVTESAPGKALRRALASRGPELIVA